jgi:hypothetical protein
VKTKLENGTRNSKDPSQVRGVVDNPEWDWLPVSNMLPPQLHILSLGLANDIIVNAFVDYIDERVDQLSEVRFNFETNEWRPRLKRLAPTCRRQDHENDGKSHRTHLKIKA